MKTALAMIAILGLVACGGGGGPGDDTQLVDLGAVELDELCGELAAVVGGPRTVTCTDGDITFGDEAAQKAECIDDYGMLPATCEATVAQARACSQAFSDDACTAAENAGCIALFACAF